MLWYMENDIEIRSYFSVIFGLQRAFSIDRKLIIAVSVVEWMPILFLSSLPPLLFFCHLTLLLFVTI